MGGLFEESNANIPHVSHHRSAAEEVGVGFEGVGIGHTGNVVDDVGNAIILTLSFFTSA